MAGRGILLRLDPVCLWWVSRIKVQLTFAAVVLQMFIAVINEVSGSPDDWDPELISSEFSSRRGTEA